MESSQWFAIWTRSRHEQVVREQLDRKQVEAFLPTIPRWNAAKMPLTSGLARAVRQLRTDLARQMEREESQSADWLVENYHLSKGNRQRG